MLAIFAPLAMAAERQSPAARELRDLENHLQCYRVILGEGYKMESDYVRRGQYAGLEMLAEKFARNEIAEIMERFMDSRMLILEGSHKQPGLRESESLGKLRSDLTEMSNAMMGFHGDLRSSSTIRERIRVVLEELHGSMKFVRMFDRTSAANQ
ncbi:hypothetical protein KBB96_14155 [Luteolibacter ambystomatis]|uniref:Uncharacterized protein n=2 Tax=Luteolibacter ambystomatis TaxID=2824561 RepID=A0A975G754_9BACT|nr:hypothetical protein [Luteolibacter ambystomatis]QUE50006.1 hypothetical protein KBB96_14155 [Luteolibacter ambystomatis]